jgi:hypothetical protein
VATMPGMNPSEKGYSAIPSEASSSSTGYTKLNVDAPASPPQYDKIAPEMME